MRMVVVGYGMAGARLAAELRGDVKVTILGAEPRPAYNRILLSAVLAGRLSEVDLVLPGARDLDVRLGTAAAAIDRAAHTVSTVDGEVIEYDHLVLATGSRAIVPPLAGLDRDDLPDRVAVFRTLDDCQRILASAAHARTALVLGGGLLGVEAARGLAGRGLEVQVVHAVGHLMERQLDPAASAVLVRTLTDLGVAVRLGAAATGVRVEADGVRLTLAEPTDSGAAGHRELRADLLVIACGVRPETGLAAAAGLAVGRGIVVDDRLRTSDRHISAIGDCAEHAGITGGLVAPAWEQARVLARVLTGVEPLARYRPVPPVTRLKAAGIDLAAMGAAEPPAGGEEVSYVDAARRTYAKLVLHGDRLAGAILLGDNPSVGTVIQLFDRGGRVPPDRRALLLGRGIAVAAAPADSPALMPEPAIVCHCNTVSKGALVRSWRDGARTVTAVAASTRATTGCGGCRDAVEGIVDWLSGAESSTVEVAP